jgi:Arc/MetJ-type ribon-helix-helix transcriptional regulator
VEPYAKSGSDVIRGAARNLAEKYRPMAASLDGQLEWLRSLDSESRAGREPDPAKADALLERAVTKKDGAVRNGPGTANDFATNGAAAWYQLLSNEGYRSADAP